MLDPRAIAVGGVGYGARLLAALGAWPTSEVETVADSVAGGRRRGRKSVVDRPVRGQANSIGRALVEVAGIRESVRPMALAGVAQVAAGVSLDMVREATVDGVSNVAVGIRGELVPVFSDDDLMALAVWASRRRH